MRRLLRGFAALALGWGVLCADLAAQSLDPGTRVRITQADGSRLVGVLGRAEPDTVWLRWGDASRVYVPLEQGTRIDVSLGRGRGANALRWAAWGAAGSAAFGATSCAFAACGSEFGGRGSPAAEAAFWFGFAGAFYGAIAGAIFGGEGWTRVLSR